MTLHTLKATARQIKRHTMTIYFAAKDPAMPSLAKAIAVLVLAYALSPIDLIPDFIPILGYLDDLLLLPLGIWLVLRLTPPPVLEAAKLKAEKVVERPVNYWMAALFVVIWLGLIAWFVGFVYQVSNS
jgi:uncharacterized membrane protein YkvA (DUF1232 family)